MENESTSSHRPAASEPAAVDLQSQVAGLRRLLLVTLLIIVGASFPLNIYLMSQVRHVTRELDRMREQRPQLEQAVAQYQNNAQPVIESLIRDLNSYAEARPQVAPLLQKYRITPQAQAAAEAPAAASTGETSLPAAAPTQ
jgi:hypothetical protein